MRARVQGYVRSKNISRVVFAVLENCAPSNRLTDLARCNRRLQSWYFQVVLNQSTSITCRDRSDTRCDGSTSVIRFNLARVPVEELDPDEELPSRLHLLELQNADNMATSSGQDLLYGQLARSQTSNNKASLPNRHPSSALRSF